MHAVNVVEISHVAIITVVVSELGILNTNTTKSTG